MTTIAEHLKFLTDGILEGCPMVYDENDPMTFFLCPEKLMEQKEDNKKIIVEIEVKA